MPATSNSKAGASPPLISIAHTIAPRTEDRKRARPLLTVGKPANDDDPSEHERAGLL